MSTFILTTNSSIQVILVSANKLTRYIEPCQLTDDFGGSLDYDHSDWLNKRLVSEIYSNDVYFYSLLDVAVASGNTSFICLSFQVFEKFTKESTSLLDELTIINDSDKSASVDKDK